MTRIVIYSQIFPFPPQNGAHHRIKQLIRYFLSRSCEVHLICHSCTWGNRFDRSVVDLDVRAHLIHFPPWGHRIDTAWKRFFARSDRSIVSKLAYSKILRRLAPDIVLMNYANSMFLLPGNVRAHIIVDTHDFQSLSRYLSIRARALLDYKKYEFSPLEFEVEKFMRNSADEISQETAALGKADLILAISKAEGKIFCELTKRSVQVLNYYTEAPEIMPPEHYSQLGIMPIGTGENPHNILGAHCIDRAMHWSNSDRAVVASVGRAAREIGLGSWCRPVGHVADYFHSVHSYNFGLCPAFWGTGAQIKQYEFAELGMPIVAYRWMVDSELWVAGENCILVDNPHAFADCLRSMASSRPMAELRERAKLLKKYLADRLVQQYAELDRRLGLRPVTHLSDGAGNHEQSQFCPSERAAEANRAIFA